MDFVLNRGIVYLQTSHTWALASLPCRGSPIRGCLRLSYAIFFFATKFCISWFVTRQIWTRVAKRSTSLFNSFCSNASKQVARFCCPFYRSLTYVNFLFCPFIDPIAMPRWWAQIRVKQLSMAATARVIWLCVCVRYWSGRGLVYVCPLL